MSRPGITAIAATTVALAAAWPLAAQSAASPGHTLLQNEASAGTHTSSSGYRLDGALRAGGRSTSASYVLTGGFPGTLLDTGIVAPRLTAVSPDTTTLLGRATVKLTGTGLDQGAAPSVLVDGTPVPVTARAGHEVTCTLPALSRPGWLPVELRTTAGTTALARGIGVLPILETDPAATSGKDFDLLFRGTKDDIVIWAVGIAPGPPIPIQGAHYGFALNPSVFLAFSGFAIVAADGVLRIPIRAATYPVGAVYLQALFVTRNQGYRPGSFSNVLRI